MSRFKPHLAQGEKVIIDGEEFLLKPLNVDSLPNFMKVMKTFSGAKDKDSSIEDMLKNIDDEGLNALKEVLYDTLKLSYPDEPEEDMKQFALKFMGQLMGPIMSMNNSNIEKEKDPGKIKEIRKTIKNADSPRNKEKVPKGN